MIKLSAKIPNKVYIAVSGGPDSMSILDFIRKGKRDITALYFHHGTKHGQEAYDFVDLYCRSNRISLITGKISNKESGSKSKEEHWRDERHDFFKTFDGPVITGHHLDDAVEWWIFSSLHGKGKLIPHRRDNVVRPFLLTPRADLLAWNRNNDLPYIIDPGNKDESFMRSIIRHKIVPEALKINPGLRKVLFKKLKIESVNFDFSY